MDETLLLVWGVNNDYFIVVVPPGLLPALVHRLARSRVFPAPWWGQSLEVYLADVEQRLLLQAIPRSALNQLLLAVNPRGHFLLSLDLACKRLRGSCSVGYINKALEEAVLLLRRVLLLLLVLLCHQLRVLVAVGCPALALLLLLVCAKHGVLEGERLGDGSLLSVNGGLDGVVGATPVRSPQELVDPCLV